MFRNYKLCLKNLHCNWGGGLARSLEDIHATHVELLEIDSDIQVSAHAEEIRSLESAVLEETSETLEAVIVSIEQSLENGGPGLDPDSAKAYQHLMQNLLGDALPNPVTLESFHGDTNQFATESTLESMKTVHAQISEYSLEKKVRTNIFEAINKITGGMQRLQERVGDLKSRAQELRSVKPEGTVSASGFAKLAFNGRVDINTVAKGVQATSTVLNDLRNGAMRQGLTALKESKEDGLANAIKDFVRSLVKYNGGKLSGHKVVEVKDPKISDWTLRLLNSAMFTSLQPSIIDDPKGGDVPNDAVNLASANEINRLLDAIDKSITELRAVDAQKKVFEKESKRIQGIGGRLMNTLITGKYTQILKVIRPAIVKNTQFQWSVLLAATKYAETHIRALEREA